MNSYPTELLAQLAPVMFVAGLNTPAPPATPSETPAAPSAPRAQDPFAPLIARLRTTLSAVRQVSIWQSEKTKTFQAVLVDKDIRFPPRKLHPPEDYPDQTPRSPLSPLTPSSPLYPDGLIAPVWIRKHTSFVPSVFVLFLHLFEFPPHTPRSPLDPPDPDRERQREAEERRQDTELAAEIAQRKKATNERSIKLTVVLLASRRMLDDPALDARLTYIRRQSGLDSRAALFVLSPVSQSELNEFVQSLQQALYEPAVDYYTSHSKRVRRKRNRHAHGSSISYPNPTVSSVPVPRPLRPEGWTVRYEYKMACFAEFRGEDEVALKHYQDAYSALLLMFASITTLPPRTKRWAEAKVLADCIDIKICKLYLYNNEHSLALSFHNTHIRKFCDFSRIWGVGEDTFEFWSWMAKQQRIMGELLEHGMRSTLSLPVHRPSSLESPITMPSQQSDALTSLGLNPAHALQHPAFYYYTSARYTEKRREMFAAALELEARGAVARLSPGFANEKKVDHFSLIVEMYTRSYELFKQRITSGSSQHNQGRLILYIALLIARTYYESEQFDMAIKFFERIAKTYRREQWDVVLRPLLSIWYACAQQTGNMELSVQLLLEMLAHGPSSDIEDAEHLEETLYGVLNSTVPSSQEPLVVELLNFQSIFRTSIHFWETDVYVEQPVMFQLTISMPGDIAFSSLSFASVSVYFTDDTLTPLVIHHSDDAPNSDKRVRRVVLGDVSRYLFEVDGPAEREPEDKLEAYLRWGSGVSVTFMGALRSHVPGILKLTKVVLTVKHNSWWIELPIRLNELRHYGDRTLETPKWLTSVDPPQYVPTKRGDCTTATVRSRPHQLHVIVSQSGPAYLDEEYPIAIKIMNADEKVLDVAFDVILHPPEDDSSVNRIILEDEESTSLIRGVRFGTLEPGAETVKTLYLLNTGALGERTLDISIRSQSVTSPANLQTPDGAGLQDVNETLQTLTVQTTDAIKLTSSVTYQRSLQPQPGLADLRTYGDELWEDRVSGEATITSVFRCAASCGLRLESVQFESQDHALARLIDYSVDSIEPEDIADDWLTGDEFTTICRVSMSQPEGPNSTIPAPGIYTVRWRRLLPNGELGALSITKFTLPPLKPPTDDLVALLDLPSTGKLHEPMVMKLTVRNNGTRTAVVTVQLEPDPSDGFVVAGLRSGRLPILLPETEATLYWKLIPVECGFAKVPRIKVVDRRKAIVPPGQDAPVAQPDSGGDAEGDIVKPVDVRWDGRTEGGEETRAAGDIGTILILP